MVSLAFGMSKIALSMMRKNNMTNNQPKKCVSDGKTYNQSGEFVVLKCKDCGNYWLKKHSVPTCHPVEIQGEEREACKHGNKGLCMGCYEEVRDSSPLPKERGGWEERFDERFRTFHVQAKYKKNQIHRLRNHFSEKDIKSFIAEEIRKAVEAREADIIEGIRVGMRKGALFPSIPCEQIIELIELTKKHEKRRNYNSTSMV